MAKKIKKSAKVLLCGKAPTEEEEKMDGRYVQWVEFIHPPVCPDSVPQRSFRWPELLTNFTTNSYFRPERKFSVKVIIVVGKKVVLYETTDVVRKEQEGKLSFLGKNGTRQENPLRLALESLKEDAGLTVEATQLFPLAWIKENSPRRPDVFVYGLVIQEDDLPTFVPSKEASKRLLLKPKEVTQTDGYLNEITQVAKAWMKRERNKRKEQCKENGVDG